MSRSGYSDDCNGAELNLWRGAVNSAINGKRGQAMLQELAAALDAMPVKELVANNFQADGQFCTLGVVGAARGLNLAAIDPEDRYSVAKAFGIAEAMAAEVMYLNDESVSDYRYVQFEMCGPLRYESRWQNIRVAREEAGAQRWQYMRDWVENHISKVTP